MKKSLVKIVLLCVYNIYLIFCENLTILVITIWETPNAFIQNCRFGHLPTYRTVKLAIIFARNFTS